jgi:hypothetical protein
MMSLDATKKLATKPYAPIGRCAELAEAFVQACPPADVTGCAAASRPTSAARSPVSARSCQP